MKTAFACTLVGGVVVLGMSQLANAASVVNGDFAAPVVYPTLFATYSPGGEPAGFGWAVLSGSVDHIGSIWNGPGGAGDQSLDMSGSSAGTIEQSGLTFSVAGPASVQFNLAGNPVGGNAVKQMEVFWGVSPVSMGIVTFDTTGYSLGNMGWTTATVSLGAVNTTDPYTLRFVSLESSAYGPALDNVSISVVPEPRAYAFAATAGLLAFTLQRRFRR